MEDLTRRGVDGVMVAFVDALAASRFDAIQIPILDALDPDRCPLALLPWLAWHYGLLHFDSRWNEALQREVVRNARQLLRERGTRPGVERALAPFGDSAQLVERRDDPTLAPGTFVVRIPEGDPVIQDGNLQREVDTAVRRAAPLTRTWTVEAGVTVGWSPVVASTARALTFHSLEGRANG
ncbi:MAG: phage tail protein I [Candidatus Devosia euplotis]|nr:phage tail protein I [Candidatus Devosia euplotis]